MGNQYSIDRSAEQTSAPGSSSACPLPESARSKAVYNVYNQRIDASACPKIVRPVSRKAHNTILHLGSQIRAWEGVWLFTPLLKQLTICCRTQGIICPWNQISSPFLGSANTFLWKGKHRQFRRAAQTQTGCTLHHKCFTMVPPVSFPRIEGLK
jgi:hypothetical protein